MAGSHRASTRAYPWMRTLIRSAGCSANGGKVSKWMKERHIYSYTPRPTQPPTHPPTHHET